MRNSLPNQTAPVIEALLSDVLPQFSCEQADRGGARSFALNLRQRHLPSTIGRGAAQRWLRRMRAALADAEVDDATSGEIMRGAAR